MSSVDRLLQLAPDGFETDAGFWEDLESAYGSPPRHYHTLDHVVEVAGHVADVASEVGWVHPLEVFVAALFHDAIYECGRTDNEALSAQLARHVITQHAPRLDLDLERVGRLIELTSRHGHHTPESVDPEEALFLDCDMAILGADPVTFARYDAQIRREYASRFEPEQVDLGRRAFLQALLDSPQIYLSGYFRSRLEALARSNLSGALGN